jgi:hypothetical protein
MAKHNWNFKVPAADDLQGWKEADGRLAGRFAEYLQFEKQLWLPRAIKRYFDYENIEYFSRSTKNRLSYKHI